MREIIWIQGPEKWPLEDLQEYADVIGGELVKFSETSYAVIGDQTSKDRMKEIEKRAKETIK